MHTHLRHSVIVASERISCACFPAPAASIWSTLQKRTAGKGYQSCAPRKGEAWKGVNKKHAQGATACFPSVLAVYTLKAFRDLTTPTSFLPAPPRPL